LSTTKLRGTGLGLAIVGRVIETHRGKIKIHSRPGKGTTFAITLPVK
jgi:signal transduction histidine kinase